MWERLDEIDGDTDFVDGAFRAGVGSDGGALGALGTLGGAMGNIVSAVNTNVGPSVSGPNLHQHVIVSSGIPPTHSSGTAVGCAGNPIRFE